MAWGADPYDPHDNIIAGAAYLRELHDRFGDRGFLAAYNAGPGRYEDHLAIGRPLPSETLAYMTAVASLISLHVDDRGNVAAAATSPWTVASIFVPRAATNFAPAQSSGNGRMQDSATARKSEWQTAFAPPSEGLFAQSSGQTVRP